MNAELGMNLDLRAEKISSENIESRINHVMDEIGKEFRFKGNALQNLLSFKLDRAKENTLETSNEYRSALIQEIQTKANTGEIASNNEETLSHAKYEALATKIIEVNKLTSEIQTGIQKLRAELLHEHLNVPLTSSSLLTKNWYSKSILHRIDNPESFTDNLLGLSIGTIESFATVGKFAYDVGKGVILLPYHVVQMARGKAKYNGVEI